MGNGGYPEPVKSWVNEYFGLGRTHQGPRDQLAQGGKLTKLLPIWARLKRNVSAFLRGLSTGVCASVWKKTSNCGFRFLDETAYRDRLTPLCFT